jgi:hypothetical protein
MPGGSRSGSTVVAFGTDAPHVYTNVATIFADKSDYDIELSTCATQNDAQTLLVNDGSSFTVNVFAFHLPWRCETQIGENPETKVVPAANQTVCFTAQNNILVLMTFASIDQGSSYVLHAAVSAWNSPGG